MPRGICPGVGLGRAERARRRALRTLHPAPRTPHPAPRTPHPAPCTRTLQEGALTRILTPTRRVDLLADVQRARDEKRPRAVLTYMWCGLRVPAFAYPPLRARGAGPLVLKAQGPCARAAGPDAPCVPCVPVYLGTTGRT